MKTIFVLLALSLVVVFYGLPAQANLVTNEGFETGDFTGWTLSVNPDNQKYVGVGAGFGNSVGIGNNYGAYFGPIGSLGFISQTLATTPGESYNLSFWLASNGGTPTNEIQVSWNGKVIYDHLNLPSQPYTLYNFVVSATLANTNLTLGLRNDDPVAYQYLDDVSVNAVPVPGAVWLLGSGLAGLGLWRGRKRFMS